MKYKLIAKPIAFFLVIAVISVFWGCQKADDYKKFIAGGEISYTGKLDSTLIYSGKNRVLVSGLLISDPKVNKIKIFWNGGLDSAVFPVKKTDKVDTIRYSINNISEGTQNFTIYTYDNEGNKSIPVFKVGRSYGSRYQAGLFNRAVNEAITGTDGVTQISWSNMDRFTGVFATELQYTSLQNTIKTIRVSIDSSKTKIKDLLPGTSFRYRTLFLPDTVSVDTFNTDFIDQKVIEDVTLKYIKNAGSPFLTADTTKARFRNLTDWITTPSVKNQNGYGGWLSDNKGLLGLQMGYDGAAKIPNGKIYQTFTLPAGKYRFELSMGDFNVNQPIYMIVANGPELPDVEQISASIAYVNFDKKFLEFSLDQSSQVSLGFLTSLTNGSQYWFVNSVKLKKL